MATNDALIEIATGSNYIFTGASDNDVVFYETSSNSKILFGTTSNTAPNLTLANAGNVGINNVNPQYDLDVTGDIRFTGNLYQGSNVFTSGGEGGGLLSFDDINNRVLSTSNSWSILTNSTNTFVAQQAAAIDGSNATDVATCVRMDTSGQMYVSGSYSNSNSPIIYNTNSSNFGSGTNSGLSFATSAAGTAFALRYTSNGVCDVRVSVDGTGLESGTGIAVDSTNSILLCGTYTSSNARVYDTMGSSAVRLPTPIGSNVAFVSKYDSNGTSQFAVGIDTSSTETANALARDGSNNIYLAGSYTNLGSNAIVYNASTEEYVPAAYGEVTTPFLSTGSTTSMIFDSNNNLVVGVGGSRLIKISQRGDIMTFAGSGSSGFSDATGTIARFNGIVSNMCFDATGNLYVTDRQNQRIRRITPSGVVTTFAGSGTASYFDANGTNAAFSSPYGICIDRSGNFYVHDIYNYVIRRITPNGQVTTLVGQNTQGFSDATGTNARFATEARGICIDTSDNLYVADYYNGRVRRITPAGVVTTLAGMGTGTLIDGGSTVGFTFNDGPQAIAIDQQNNIYARDSAGIIRRITPSGFVTTVAGNANTGLVDGLGTNAQFPTIGPMCPDIYGNLYVGLGANQNIRRVELVSSSVTTLAGNGTATSVNGTGINATINYPIGIATDLSGNVYVADYAGHRIRRITPAGVVSTFAGSGTGGFSDANGTIAMFNNPGGICIDRSQNIYVCDFSNNRIRLITPSGVVSTFAGSGTTTRIDGVGTNAGIGNPGAICMDFNGDVLVCDRSSHTIRRITPTAVVTTIAGTGTTGFSDATGTNAAFNNPNGICADNTGNIYVSDRTNHRVRRITSAGVVSTIAGSGTGTLIDGIGTNAAFSQPCGLWTDQNNNIYVADLGNNCIRKISTSGPSAFAVTTLIGSTTSGFSDASGTNARFLNPECLCIDTNGVMYISDANNNRVRTIVPPNVVTTFAGSGTNAFIQGTGTNAAFTTMYQMCSDLEGSIYVGMDYGGGVSMRKISSSGVTSSLITGIGNIFGVCMDDNFNGYFTVAGFAVGRFNRTGSTVWYWVGSSSGSTGFSDAAGNNARFGSAYAVCVERAGTNIYVTDINRIRRIVPTSAIVTTIAGNAGAGFSDATGTNALFNAPRGICVDSTGIVYVADTGNNRIRRIGLDGVVTTLAGSGSAGSTDGVGTNASFNSPQQLCIDYSDVMYLADQGNTRIRRITTAGIVTTIAGGTSGYSDGLGTNARFTSTIGGICVDFNNNMYVADSGNFRIRKINACSSFINGMSPSPIVTLPTSRVYTGIVSPVPYAASAYSEVTTFAGSGTGTYVDGTGTNAGFNVPSSMCLDPSGNMYVSDSVNRCVRRITPGGVVSLLAGSPGVSGFSDATGTNALFQYPVGICIDSSGILYVADQNNNRIRRITQAGVVSTFAGQATAGFSDATGTNAMFNFPFGITIDSNGNLYVCERFGNRVRSISPSGVVATVAGQTTAGFSDATGTNAMFSGAYGICIDSSNNLYVADRGNNIVRRVTLAGVVSTIAGSTLASGFSDATGTNARFNGLFDVKVDASNIIYATESLGNRVRRVTTTGVVTTLAGSGTATYSDGVGTNAWFNGPSGLVIDSIGNMYVSDQQGHRIRRIELAGVSVSSYAGSGTATFTDGNGVFAGLNNPSGICMDANRTMYVADFNNHRIRRITASGDVSVLAGSGVAGYADGLGTNARFNQPNALCLDSSGNLYVTDQSNHVIRRITPTGLVSTFAGNGVAGFSDATGTNAQFNSPYGVCIDSTGILYVTEFNGHRVRRINLSRAVTTYAGTGTAGSTNATGTNASFNNPSGICIDTSGNLYVNEYTGCLVRRVSTSQVVTTLAGGGVSGSTDGVGTNARFWDMFMSCIDSQNNILLLDRNHRVRKVSQSGVVTTLAGSGTATFLDGIGTNAGFNVPVGICTDSLGVVYVADYTNNRVRMITPPMNVTTFAGSSQGFSDGTGISSQLNTPSGIAMDASGNMYVTEAGSRRIRKITPTGVVTLLAGNGTSGFSDATGTNALFNNPQGIVVVPSGNNIYVSDTGNNRIRVITSAGLVTTLAGQATAGFSDATGTNALFNEPRGIAIDVNGNIYVADRGNNRIRRVTASGVVTTFAGSGTATYFDAVGTNAGFRSPWGIAVDTNGNVYVNENNTGIIRKISPTAVVTSFSSGYGDIQLGIVPDVYGNVFVNDFNTLNIVSPSGVRRAISGTSSALDGIGTNAGLSRPQGIVIDANGNLFTADSLNHRIRKISNLSSVTYNLDVGMSSSNTAAFAVRYNSFGTAQWSLTMDGAATDATMALATDNSQNLYMAGYYGPNQATFYQGNTPSIVSLRETTSNSMGAFCSKADSNGIFNWAVSMDGATTDQALGVAADTSGNVYVCGTYGPNAATVYHANNSNSGITLPAVSNLGCFVLRYTSNGILSWARTIRGVSSNIAYGIALDNSANVYVGGLYQGATSPSIFGANDSNTTLSLPAPTGNAGSNTAGFVVRYNSSGTPQNAWAVGGRSNAAVYSVAVDGSGSNVAIAGLFTGGGTNTIMYDPNQNPASITFPSAITTQAGCVVKYSLSGTPSVLRSIGSNGQQKFVTNIGSSNLVLNVTNSNNTVTNNSYTLTPGTGMIFNYYGSNWYAFNN
jgi:mucin-19